MFSKMRRWKLRHIDNKNSWVSAHELGTTIPEYRRTFDTGDFYINDNHRYFSECPVSAPDSLIDIGLPGWLRREDALKLYELAYFSNGDILELGTYQGLSTSIIARAVADSRSGRTVTTVELDASASARAQEVLRPYAFIRVLLEDASAYCASSGERGDKFGLVFVDHSHAYEDVARVCRLLPTIVVKDGFALFHDFNDRRNNDRDNSDYGVSTAVIENLSTAEFDFFGLFGCAALYKRR